MKTLHPPLAVLESELFSPSFALLEQWRLGLDIHEEMRRALDTHSDALAYRAAVETVEAEVSSMWEEIALIDDADIPLMPPDLQAAIRNRIAVRETTFSPFPTQGQIVGIEEVRGPKGALDVDLPRPIAVCINRPTKTSGVWCGWVVGEEKDYAADLDVIIGMEDEPCDPIAQTIQLWNPVDVYLPSTSCVLGEISLERLATIRRLDAEFFITPRPTAPAEPGKTLLQTLSNGAKIRTGTPLGDMNDPRHRYQVLYHTYAEAVREPARLAHAQLTLVERVIESLRAARTEWGNRLGRIFPQEPRLVHAMGAEATKWEPIGDWLELHVEKDETKPDTVHLRIRSVGTMEFTVQRLNKGRVRRQDYVAPGKDIRIPITIAPDTELVFSNENEGITLPWKLPT